MPQVGFELMTPMFERPKTVHAATVIGANLVRVYADILMLKQVVYIVTTVL
jgi:hypothetical protein